MNFQIFLTDTDLSTFLGPIVVFCRSGARAKTAKEALESLGYKKVSSSNRFYDNENSVTSQYYVDLNLSCLNVPEIDLQCRRFERYGLLATMNFNFHTEYYVSVRIKSCICTNGMMIRSFCHDDVLFTNMKNIQYSNMNESL